MQTWFTSDEHHGHFNAMTGWAGMKGAQRPRPWVTLEGMTEGLIDRHNSVVRPGDNVYHLGDMFWRTLGVEKALHIMRRLNGNHYYVRGNHEEIMDAQNDFYHPLLTGQFVWIKERAKIRPDKRYPSIVLDHYAGRVWDGSYKGNFQLYGHSHGNIPNFNRSMDVGVDAGSNNWTPVSLDQIVAALGDQPIELPFTPRV